MAISDKLEYLNDTKQLLKDKINNLGGSITDETTFRQYVNQLDGVYDVLPKTEFQEGTEVTIENGLKGKIDFDEGKVGFGQASQESTQGYNLINVAGARADTPVAGVSVSKDGDSIILNGSRTDGSTSNSKNVIYATNSLNLESGDYRLTFVPESGSLNGGRLGVLFFNSNGDGIAYIEIFSGTTTTKSITLNSDVATLTVFYNGAFSATNYKFKVMLSQGTTERTYEQYSGGYASPSPNWEQEVKWVAGRNLLNPSNVIHAVCGASVGSTGTLGAYENSFTTWIRMEKNKSYSFSGDLTNVNANVVRAFVTNSEVAVGTTVYRVANMTSSSVYTNSSNYKYLVLEFLDVDEYEGEWQIEEGSTAHPYLPYNTIEEVERGINYANYSLLFNNTDCYSISNDNISLLQNDSRATTLIDGTTWGISFKKGTYTLYTSGTGISPQIQIIGKAIGQITRVNYSQLVTFNLSQDDIVAIKYLNTASFPINLGKVMIIEGTITNTPTYEPYVTPRTYQFSLGNNKLYDECYIVGRPDNWKIVSNWYRLTSAEFINLTIGTTGNNKQFVVVKSNFNVKPKPGKIYCTHLKYNPTTWYADGYCGIVTPGATLWMQMTQAFESVDAFKTFITTNNMEIVYQTEEPIETPITDTTLITQLNNWYYSQPFNGTTIIESNGDLPMIIKVRALKGE